MKLGEKFLVNNRTMIEAMAGRVLDVTVDSQTVTARIVEVNGDFTTLSVLSPGTKE